MTRRSLVVPVREPELVDQRARQRAVDVVVDQQHDVAHIPLTRGAQSAHLVVGQSCDLDHLLGVSPSEVDVTPVAIDTLEHLDHVAGEPGGASPVTTAPWLDQRYVSTA